jgi:lipid II:glycine glycyltransferase (peptidoglycan interpeptide bridge formation enzyme)
MRCDSLGYDCYAGPLVAPDLAAEDRDAVFDALLRAQTSTQNVLETLFPPSWVEQTASHSRLLAEHGYRAVRGYPIAVKDLRNLDPSTLARSFAKNHRNAADAAKRRGVNVSKATDIGDYLEFSDLLDETMEHVGLNVRYSKDFIVESGRALVREQLATLLLARVDGQPVAGVFMLHARHHACYWLGATAKDERALKARPMNAIFPLAFAIALEKGCDWFELGGLMTPGLRAFKTGWGTQEYQQLTYEKSYRNLVGSLRGLREWLRGMRAARAAGGRP